VVFIGTPKSDGLETDIGYLGFHRDSDEILQIASGNQLPPGVVWTLDETSLILFDKNQPTCASALLDGDLGQIKSLCYYGIHKSPYPRSAHHLQDNHFILTNVSQLQLICIPANGSANI